MLNDPKLNAGYLARLTVTAPDATDLAEDGKTITAAGLELKVIHTPGHTPGSVCYELEDALFTGDTVFQHGFGRTDLPGGSMQALRDSLRKLEPLLMDHGIYPGHGG